MMHGEDTARRLWRHAEDHGVLVVCLVRHGQTAWNASGRFLGRTDIALDEVGRVQASSFARALPGRFAQIYSSPLARARQTAEALEQPVIEIPDLMELDQGALEGLDGPTAVQRFPEFFLSWREDPEHAQVPGGESLGVLRRRAVAGLRAMVAERRPGEVIGAFTHQMVIAALTCTASGDPLARWRRYRVGNTHLTALAIDQGTLTVLERGLSLTAEASHA